MWKFKTKSWWRQYLSSLCSFPLFMTKYSPPCSPWASLGRPGQWKLSMSLLNGTIIADPMLKVLFTRWDIYLLSPRMLRARKASNEFTQQHNYCRSHVWEPLFFPSGMCVSRKDRKPTTQKATKTGNRFAQQHNYPRSNGLLSMCAPVNKSRHSVISVVPHSVQMQLCWLITLVLPLSSMFYRYIQSVFCLANIQCWAATVVCCLVCSTNTFVFAEHPDDSGLCYTMLSDEFLILVHSSFVCVTIFQTYLSCVLPWYLVLCFSKCVVL